MHLSQKAWSFGFDQNYQYFYQASKVCWTLKFFLLTNKRNMTSQANEEKAKGFSFVRIKKKQQINHSEAKIKSAYVTSQRISWIKWQGEPCPEELFC